MTTLLTATATGLTASAATIQVTSRRGLPKLELLGLPTAFRRELHAKIVTLAAFYKIPLRSQSVIAQIFPVGQHAQLEATEAAFALAIFAELADWPLPDNLAVLGQLRLNGDLQPFPGFPLMWRALPETTKTIISATAPYGSVLWPTAAAQQAGCQLLRAENMEQLLMWMSQTEPLSTWDVPEFVVTQPKRTHSALPKEILLDLRLCAEKRVPVLIRGNDELLSQYAKDLLEILPNNIVETAEHDLIYRMSGDVQLKQQVYEISGSTKLKDIQGTIEKVGVFNRAHGKVLLLKNLNTYSNEVLTFLEKHCAQLPNAQQAESFQAKPYIIGHLPWCACGKSGTKKTCVCTAAEQRKFATTESRILKMFSKQQ